MNSSYVRMLREAAKRKLEEKKEERLSRAASRPRLEEKSGEASMPAVAQEAQVEIRAPIVPFGQAYVEMKTKLMEEKQSAPPSLGSMSDKGYEFIHSEETSTAVGPMEEKEVPATAVDAPKSVSETDEAAVDRVIQEIIDQSIREDDVVAVVPPMEGNTDPLTVPSFDLQIEEKEAEDQEIVPPGEVTTEGEVRVEAPIEVLDSLLALKVVGQNPDAIPGPDTSLTLRKSSFFRAILFEPGSSLVHIRSYQIYL